MKHFNNGNRSGQGRGFDRNSRGGFRGHDRKREMFKVVCDECGKECEVPFRPTDGRPVYCSECFEKKDGGSHEPRSFNDRDRGPRKPRFEREDSPRPVNNDRLVAIEQKLDNVLEVLTALLSSVEDTEEVEEIENTEEVEEEKKPKKEKQHKEKSKK